MARGSWLDECRTLNKRGRQESPIPLHMALTDTLKYLASQHMILVVLGELCGGSSCSVVFVVVTGKQ
jgi:hypothetical protein